MSTEGGAGNASALNDDQPLPEKTVTTAEIIGGNAAVCVRDKSLCDGTNLMAMKDIMDGTELDGTNDDGSCVHHTTIRSDANVENVKNVEKEGVVIKNIENNESFRNLLVYDNDSSSSSDVQCSWRESKNDDSDDWDDDGDIPVSSGRGAIRKNKDQTAKPLGELSLDDLPPVPDISTLDINLENEEFVHMGHILGIVDKLVTVEAIPNSPAYDLETLLFLDGKRPLGFVFDVLGQVSSPIYAIRFNSTEDIKEMRLTAGLKVYSAPTSKHTQYVFLQQLLKMKGSDASWLGDNEVPQEFADYSDDENEYNSRSGRKTMTQLRTKRSHNDYQHKKFESTMNKRNLLDTKFNKYMDNYRQARQNRRAKQQIHQQQSQIDARMPLYNPTIPPPNLGPIGRYSYYLANPPMTYLPPEFLASLANNNSNTRYDPEVGAYVNVENINYNASFLYPSQTSNFISENNSANYFTNNAWNDNPGPSHK